ncbi:MAG TPA: bacillithiol system redox-active protein YtxJ [Gemmatirosa sp.]|jgi:bacillithiol system protein YtxJ|nr:bacillithiol system redox-active protein YtxJ [Gemmatirosa sp.]
MRPLVSSADLDALLAEPVALLFKHSDRCPISGVAHDQIRALARRRPELPIWVVDVIDDRSLSQRVAERLHVHHQSPQAILVVAGAPAWAVSHFQVRLETLERRLSALLDAPADEPGERSGERRGEDRLDAAG